MARRTLTDPTAVVARRGGAWFIDVILTALAAAVPALVLADAYSLNRPSDGFEVERHAGEVGLFLFDTVVVLRNAELAITLGAFALAVLLVLVVLPGRRGWSPGYLAADLRLVRADGSHAGVGRALLRTLAWLVDGLPGLPLVGYAVARTTRRHQRLGDLLARTYVVDKRAAGHAVDRPVGADDPVGTPVLEPVLEPVLDQDVEPGPGPEPDPPTADGAADEPPAGPAVAPSTPLEPAEPVRATAAAAVATATAPEGVPADQPIWDRRNRRYVLWHSGAGRWLTHTDRGWRPFDDDGPATPGTQDRGEAG